MSEEKEEGPVVVRIIEIFEPPLFPDWRTLTPSDLEKAHEYLKAKWADPKPEGEE